MNDSISTMKLRIQTLQLLVEEQSDAYVKGYIDAKKENKMLLSDIKPDELREEYLASLYKKASAHF